LRPSAASARATPKRGQHGEPGRSPGLAPKRSSEVCRRVLTRNFLDQPRGAYDRPSHRADIKYLLSLDVGALGSGKAEAMHRQMEAVWNDLGLSVQQKIALLMKYSNSPSESVGIGAVLAAWERALSVVKTHEHCYANFKNFLLVARWATAHAETVFGDHVVGMQMAESALAMAADTLKRVCGDELFVWGQKAADFLAARSHKLAVLKEAFRL